MNESLPQPSPSPPPGKPSPPPGKPSPWKLGPAVFIATGGWIGFFPFAPGTVGTLLGIPLSIAILKLPSIWGQLVVIAVLCGVGIPICTAAVRRMGGKKDPGSIVLDEIASLPIVFLFVPQNILHQPWVWAAGFVLHRVFDISKPPPARQLEGLPDGLGIMADDWIAGIYGCLALHAILRFV